jgi:lysophospholipase L1-like esterase
MKRGLKFPPVTRLCLALLGVALSTGCSASNTPGSASAGAGGSSGASGTSTSTAGGPTSSAGTSGGSSADTTPATGSNTGSISSAGTSAAGGTPGNDLGTGSGTGIATSSGSSSGASAPASSTAGSTGTGNVSDASLDAGRDASFGDAAVDPSKKITLWLAGDSTMMTCTNSVCPCGWGQQFQPYFNGNVTVVDSAAGGRSIQTWLYDPNVGTTMGANGECVISPMTYSMRWQAMLDATSGMKPGDWLFVAFGINDGDPTCNRHVGTALFEQYLGAMATAAKMRGAQTVFLTSTSYMQCTGATVTPNRGFGPETKAAGTANGVPVIDLTTLSASLYTTLGLCPNDGNFASTTEPVGLFFCNDHTHFEVAGATKIAGVVAQALRDQNIPLAAYLK